ncbi:MAG: hypothetical protein IPO37_13300 [Saprospiraceae bacterium]|nr:hypothetical protein [Saprospiraceae bacterium]
MCTRFDELYNRILEDCGCFIGDREQKNNFSFIREKYNCLLDEVENDTVLGIYPEVGTSGKREGKSPYDLSAFRTGFAYLSYEFKIPVLPIVQVFDEFLNIHIKVLNPSFIKKLKSDALLIKSEMQKAINLTIENL